jgi:hypothetical protein
MSVIFATQLTAVFTAILGAGAIVTAMLAGLAFRKQSQEVALLLEQTKRDTDERRSAQAARIFLVLPGDDDNPGQPFVRNASDLPAYDISVGLAGSELLRARAIMPGETIHVGTSLVSRAEATQIILGFRDSAGIPWVRTPYGVLERTEFPPSRWW